MWSSLGIAQSVIPDSGNLFSKFEHCMIFCFRGNGAYGADGQTDRQTDRGTEVWV